MEEDEEGCLGVHGEMRWCWPSGESRRVEWMMVIVE